MAMNLLGNAIKYTPPGGHVGVSLRPENVVVILEVTDTGIGIPAEDQPYVFDKFYRSDRVVGEYEGTGLGLSIVKSIVDQHAGRIWLESKEGGGTKFVVVLPIDRATNAPSTTPKAAQP
jgi:signal transduction histidine kinase